MMSRATQKLLEPNRTAQIQKLKKVLLRDRSDPSRAHMKECFGGTPMKLLKVRGGAVERNS